MGTRGTTKGRRKRSATADAEGVQWPRNGFGRRLSRVALVTPDELKVHRLGEAGEVVVGRIDTAENAVSDAMYRPVRVRLEAPQRAAGRAR